MIKRYSGFNRKLIKMIIVLILLLRTTYVIAIIDSNPSNSELDYNVSIVETNNITVLFVPIDNDNGFESTFQNASLFFNSTYPGSVKFKKGRVIQANDLIDKQNSNGESKLKQILNNLEELGDLADADYTVGIVQTNLIDYYAPQYSDAVGFHSPSTPKAVFAEVDTLGTSLHEILHSNRFCDERDQTTWRESDDRPFNRVILELRSLVLRLR